MRHRPVRPAGGRTDRADAVFRDRVDAGRQLAARLGYLQGQPVTVLGLPRGGVPVAAEVAGLQNWPLDVVVVRKLGLPTRPELAMGAIAEGGVRVLDPVVLADSGIAPDELHAIEVRERDQLDARVARLRHGRPPADLRGRVAVVVDDGLATGSTARAACLAARRRHAERVVLAVPVAPADAAMPEADELVCAAPVVDLTAVGNHYQDFRQTEDQEVLDLLAAAARRAARTGSR